jgi:RNA recognition motif-containing protein
MQIYVGNLPEDTTEASLKKMFAPHGTVKAASIGKDKGDKPQGYGFVEMPVKSEARNAIEALRGKEIEGKPLLVRALKADDAFHQHAVAMQGGSRPGASFNGKTPRGNITPRAGGAVRRSGKRGS